MNSLRLKSIISSLVSTAAAVVLLAPAMSQAAPKRDAKLLVAYFCKYSLSSIGLNPVENCDVLQSADWKLKSTWLAHNFGWLSGDLEVNEVYQADTSIGHCEIAEKATEVRKNKAVVRESLELNYYCGSPLGSTSEGHIEFKDKP